MARHTFFWLAGTQIRNAAFKIPQLSPLQNPARNLVLVYPRHRQKRLPAIQSEADRLDAKIP